MQIESAVNKSDTAVRYLIWPRNLNYTQTFHGLTLPL